MVGGGGCSGVSTHLDALDFVMESMLFVGNGVGHGLKQGEPLFIPQQRHRAQLVDEEFHRACHAWQVREGAGYESYSEG